MSKLDLLTGYLDDHQDLWWTIDEFSPPLPIMDVAGDIIDEKDYYGCDFSGNGRVLKIFFTGQHAYFPGIHIGDNDDYAENIDQLPVYVFNLSDSNEPLTYVGNFKDYLTQILDYCIGITSGDIYDELVSARDELEQFSDITIQHEEYKLKEYTPQPKSTNIDVDNIGCMLESSSDEEPLYFSFRDPLRWYPPDVKLG